MTAALVLLPLLGFILFWRRIADTRSSAAALHTASAIMVALYVAALADLLLPVTALLLIVGMVLAIYEILNLSRNGAYFPMPIGVLLGLCTLFTLLHHDSAYLYYDEYSHWGIFLREMLARDALWGSESNAMVLRYPPGAPLWQYLFLRFTSATEGGSYLAQFSLLMLPLLVLWQGVRWKQAYWMLAVFALVVLALSNFGHGFASLYVDHVMGAWFAGTIFSFMLDVEDRSPRQLLVYVLPVAALVLIKDSGLYFAAAAVGIMALLQFWRVVFVAGQRNLKIGLVKSGTLAFVGIVAAGLVATSWNANRNAAGIPASTYSAGGIVSGITSGESDLSNDEKHLLTDRFLEVVFHHQISKDEQTALYNEFSYTIMPQFTQGFRLTTASLILFFALWQIFVLYRLVDPGERWRWAISGLGLVLSAGIYLGILFLSYRFAFGERGITLPSYVRYAHSALLPLVLFVFLPLIPGFRRNPAKLINLPNSMPIERSATIFAIVLGALFIFETPHMTPLFKRHETVPVRLQIAPLAEKVRNLVGDERLWIYLPVPDANGQLGRIFLYELTPVQTEIEADSEFLTRDLATIQDVFVNKDFLWFPVQDPQLDDNLRLLFGEDLKDRVFRVDQGNGTVEIVALGGIFD